MTQLIRIGHSPDADDAFMFYAMTHGKVTIPGVRIEHVLRPRDEVQERYDRLFDAYVGLHPAISPVLRPLLADVQAATPTTAAGAGPTAAPGEIRGLAGGNGHDPLSPPLEVVP